MKTRKHHSYIHISEETGSFIMSDCKECFSEDYTVHFLIQERVLDDK